MTVHPVSRMARLISHVFLAGLLITGVLALIQLAVPSHGSPAAAAVSHSMARPSTVQHGVAQASPRPFRHPAVVATGRAQRGSHTYVVRTGDTLSSIARRFYGAGGAWAWLYHVNSARIQNPDLIYTGQVLTVPGTVPAGFSAASASTGTGGHGPSSLSAAGHTTAATSPLGRSYRTGAVSRTTAVSRTKSAPPSHAPATVPAATVPAGAVPAAGGTYGCSGLEAIWEQAGGRSSAAFMAAEIAMAESSGNPNAISPTNDYGLWQINGSNGSLATLSPLGSARSAVALSRDGTDWSPWTTYATGRYQGQC